MQKPVAVVATKADLPGASLTEAAIGAGVFGAAGVPSSAAVFTGVSAATGAGMAAALAWLCDHL